MIRTVPGHELGRPRALAAVPLHVAHRAVAAEREPALEARLVGVEIRRGNAELVEAELSAEAFDVAGEALELCGV